MRGNHSRKRRKQRRRPGPSAPSFGSARLPLTAADPPPELLGLVVSRPCLLCGGRSAVAGFFAPTDQGRFRPPAGRLRLLAYALCLPCSGRPDCLAAVEAVLFAAFPLPPERN